MSRSITPGLACTLLASAFLALAACGGKPAPDQQAAAVRRARRRRPRVEQLKGATGRACSTRP